MWWPHLQVSVLYSEILDRYFRVVVTDSTLNQIDACFGFDNYLLKTPVPDLDSKLAVKLKRTLLLALARKDFYHDDEDKQQEILARYKEHILPV